MYPAVAQSYLLSRIRLNLPNSTESHLFSLYLYIYVVAFHTHPRKDDMKGYLLDHAALRLFWRPDPTNWIRSAKKSVG